MLIKKSMKLMTFTLALLASCAACLPVLAEGAAAEKGEKLLYESRDEIPVAYRWKLADIFPSLEAWDAGAATLKKRLPELEGYRGRLGESASVLADALDLRYELERALDDLYVYAAQWQSTDTRDAAANSYRGRAEGLAAQLGQTSAFIPAELVQIPPKKMAAFLAHPKLATYRHVIDNILRSRAHVRSKEVEEILAGASLLTGAPVQIYQGMVSADIPWPEFKGEDSKPARAIPALFYSYMASQDRRVRRDAALALFGSYDRYAHALASTYAASVNKDIWLARTRHYDSTLDMALDQPAVPRAIVDNLVSTVHENVDAIQDYVALRKRVLGLDDFHIYDLYVSMVPDSDRHFSFDEGWKLAMSFWTETYGEEYASVAKKALASRWVDVYPNTGKQGGAYSWGSYNSHPYLFLNWGGTLDDVFTLVHEMGHSIHTYLANEANPSHNADYSLFVAEVASVASESLFFEWLYERTSDPSERLALVNLRVNNVTGTFLRQIFFHEFEASAHAAAEAGKPLTKDTLGEIWGKLWLSYYGEGATLDPEFRAGWARIPHFYRTFYVWKYATSFAAGEAIAARVRSGDKSAVQDYLAALKLGGSVYPMEALKRAGVDMNDPAVIRSVMVRYRELLAEMNKLL